jgi:hypothetical protein
MARVVVKREPEPTNEPRPTSNRRTGIVVEVVGARIVVADGFDPGTLGTVLDVLDSRSRRFS